MAWSDKIFAYCERASDPAIWAEPLNAITNLAFILAGALAIRHYAALPSQWRHPLHVVLICLVLLIGVGSGLFHTFADRWSVLADVIPITLFIYIYLYVALTKFLKLSLWQAGGILIGFFVLSAGLSDLKCFDGLIALDLAAAPSSRPCLNGSVPYLPPLLAMLIIGGLLKFKEHPAGNMVILAGVVFALSLTFRTLDSVTCSYTMVGSEQIGVHFIWHLLNACVLYSLLRAALNPKAFAIT